MSGFVCYLHLLVVGVDCVEVGKGELAVRCVVPCAAARLLVRRVGKLGPLRVVH